MRVNTARGVLADTGFWIALYDQRQGANHTKALNWYNQLGPVAIVFPWPLFYEILRTRVVRHHDWTSEFAKVARSGRLAVVDDNPYRENALADTFAASVTQRRSISLTDHVIRRVLSDSRLRIAELWTFNVGDFADICQHRNIPIKS